jgi:hypothetical protein
MVMTEHQAKELAKFDETYRARKLRGQWVVWCDASDSVVEFDRPSIRSLHNASDWKAA